MRKTIAVLLALLLFACVACEAQPKPLSRTDYLLDTVVTLTLYDAREADLDAAFKEIRRLNDLLDAYAPFSDLGWLQAAAGLKPVTVASETMELLVFAKDMYERTGGYLDVTVGPLIDLWDIGNGGHYPTEAELTAARGLLGMDDLILDEANGTAYLARPGMRVDLGALAKGYIADKVKALLLDRGVKSGVIDLGRNILLSGEKPGGAAFSIGVQSPMNSGDLLRVLALKDKSLAAPTSDTSSTRANAITTSWTPSRASQRTKTFWPSPSSRTAPCGATPCPPPVSFWVWSRAWPSSIRSPTPRPSSSAPTAPWSRPPGSPKNNKRAGQATAPTTNRRDDPCKGGVAPPVLSIRSAAGGRGRLRHPPYTPSAPGG